MLLERMGGAPRESRRRVLRRAFSENALMFAKNYNNDATECTSFGRCPGRARYHPMKRLVRSGYKPESFTELVNLE